MDENDKKGKSSEPEAQSTTTEPLPITPIPTDNSIWRNIDKKEVDAIVAGSGTVVGLAAAFIVAGL